MMLMGAMMVMKMISFPVDTVMMMTRVEDAVVDQLEESHLVHEWHVDDDDDVQDDVQDDFLAVAT